MVPNIVVLVLIITVVLAARYVYPEQWIATSILAICTGTLGNVLANRSSMLFPDNS